jgi:DNA-binding PadR family transcriptional regulator
MSEKSDGEEAKGSLGHLRELELVVMLSVLRIGDNAYGVTIREELERRTSRTLSLGAVYKTLGRLHAKGYLQTRVAPPTPERGGRRKKLYRLTTFGLQATRRSLADLQKLAEGLEPELEVP